MQGQDKRIRIHTMLDRVKTYTADSYYDNGKVLEIVGKNEQSGVEGEFRFPLINIEHYNVITKDVEINITPSKEN